MSQPMFTMVAITRCATKPVESRMTVTGAPSAAKSACAASRMAGVVAGVVMMVRRATVSSGKSVSTATTRVASRCSATAVVVASKPSGVTTMSESGAGVLPVSMCTAASCFAMTFSTCSRAAGDARLIHTRAGSCVGAGGSSGTCCLPST